MSGAIQSIRPKPRRASEQLQCENQRVEHRLLHRGSRQREANHRCHSHAMDCLLFPDFRELSRHFRKDRGRSRHLPMGNLVVENVCAAPCAGLCLAFALSGLHLHRAACKSASGRRMVFACLRAVSAFARASFQRVSVKLLLVALRRLQTRL